ncbi:MAG TPA: M20/M25/M40 family metallo-hydrolase, partial [Abditibacteriaceae bacterium]|nr:M20/M25/M40 family metallo-hydrolase [Abditibacteriaceae bacterium]
MKHPAVEILEDLVAIQSVNPALEDGARGERELSEYVEARCLRNGLKVTRQAVLPGRDNLIIELRTGKPSTLLFEAHMDTVVLGSMVDPLTPNYRDGRMYARGACDTKGTLAGMLYSMEQAAAHPDELACDLVMCCAIDEEYLFRGILAFCDLDIPINGAVVGEPTEMRIVVAHKGIARFAV